MTTPNQDLISILIPCYNEEHFIVQALDSILSQSVSQSNLEIFVIDGESTDGSRSVLATYLTNFQNVHLLNNPGRTAPCALNIGLTQAHGAYIARMDVHATYPTDYLEKLKNALIEFNADNVGGAFRTLPGADTPMARTIALAMAHPFGIGNSEHRTGITISRETDTVPYGFYRRDVFDRIGLFDEELTRNQDDEFNARLINAGGKIVMVAGVEINYFARASLYKMASMFYQYGLFKPLVNIKLGSAATFRQFMPPLLLAGLIGSLLWLVLSPVLPLLPIVLLGVSYFALAFSFSGALAAKDGGISIFIRLPLVFSLIHLSYGYGYWRGLVKFRWFKNWDISTIRSMR